MRVYIVVFWMIVFNFASIYCFENQNQLMPKSFEYHSLSHPLTNFNNINKYIIERPNVDSIVNFEKEHSDTDGAFRFGVQYNVELTIQNSGTWDILEDSSRMLRFMIIATEAKSINFIMDKYKIPEGAMLHIYSIDKKVVYGPFYSKNSNKGGKFASAIVPSDTMIIEYWHKTDSKDSLNLNVNSLIYGYTDFKEKFSKAKKERNDLQNIGNKNVPNNLSDSSTDVNCSEGVDRCNEKRAVCRIYVGGQCITGCLINNTNNDHIPYILTALHAINIIGNDYSSYVFQFGYMNAICGDNYSLENGQVYSGTSSGCTLKSSNSNTDFALLEMDSQPVQGDSVYYAGWSYTVPQYENEPVCTTLHHVLGAPMKISRTFNNDPAVSVNLIYFGGGWVEQSFYPPDVGNFWRFQTNTDESFFDNGASGAPFFDLNHRIVGQLKGHDGRGGSYTKVYGGKFSLSWYGGGTDASQLAHWLAPDWTSNDGNISVEGIGFPANKYGRTIETDWGDERDNRTFFNNDILRVGSLNNNSEVIPFVTNYNDIPNYEAILNCDLVSTKAIIIRPCTQILKGTTFKAYISCSNSALGYSDADDVYTSNCSDYGRSNSIKSIDNKKDTFSQQTKNKAINASQILSIFPNPVNSEINIKYSIFEKSDLKIVITNLINETELVVLNKESHNSGIFTIKNDISKLTSGLYYCSLITPFNVITKSFMVVK